MPSPNEPQLSESAELLLLFLASREWGGPVDFLPSTFGQALSRTAAEVVEAFVELSRAGMIGMAPRGSAVVIERAGAEWVLRRAGGTPAAGTGSTPLRSAAERLFLDRLLVEPPTP